MINAQPTHSWTIQNWRVTGAAECHYATQILSQLFLLMPLQRTKYNQPQKKQLHVLRSILNVKEFKVCLKFSIQSSLTT